MLSDKNWERRIRRSLTKSGLRLHKLRGGYIVENGRGENKWFSGLYSLQGFTELLKEKVNQ